MLNTHLKNAIQELDNLISLTKEDIELVKAAKHDELTSRDKLKQHSLKKFESTKSMLNNQLLKLTKESGNELSEILDESENRLLEEFKSKLVELKETNKNLSLLVVVVGEFYRSLFDRMFTFDSQGYTKTKPLPAAMLKVSA